jgi:hypothetical protein
MVVAVSVDAAVVGDDVAEMFRERVNSVSRPARVSG